MKNQKKSVLERIGEIIEEIQKAENPKENSFILITFIFLILLGMAIFIAVSVETGKKTKALEQREFLTVINQVWGKDVK